MCPANTLIQKCFLKTLNIPISKRDLLYFIHQKQKKTEADCTSAGLLVKGYCWNPLLFRYDQR